MNGWSRASQLRNWAATDSQLLAWSRPVAEAVAAA